MKLLFAAMSLVCALGFSRAQGSSAAVEGMASAPVLAEEAARAVGEGERPEALATCPAYYTCWATGRVYSDALSCNRDCAPAGCLIDHYCNGSCFCP